MFFRREPLPFVAPLQLKGCTRIPSLCSTTTPLEASGPRARFVLVPSTSTSGSNRRVPPPRGFLLAAHPRAFLRARLAVLWFLLRGDNSCRGSPPADPFSAGSALPSSLGISSLSNPPICGVFGFRGRRMCCPVCDRFRFCPSLLVRLLFSCTCTPGLFLPGRLDVFLAVLTYLLEDLRGKVNGFIAYMAVDPNCFFFLHLFKGVVRVVSKVVSHFGGCGFPAGRTIDEIYDLHHTDRSTLSGLHAVPLLFLFEKGRGQVQGYLRSLGLSSSWVPRWELIVLKFQGPRCGSTRPQAFDEAASRPPAVVDSPSALAFNEAEVRAWIDNLLLEHSKECERDRTNSPGLFLHGHPGARSKWLVRRLRRMHSLGLGGC